MKRWAPKPATEAAATRARLIAAGKKVPAPKVRRVQHEARFQEQTVKFLELALRPDEVFWSATLNGAKVTEETRRRLTSEGLRSGVLDIVVIPLDGSAMTYWLELKAGKNTARGKQKIVIKALGPNAAVVRTIDEVYAALNRWNLPLHARPS